VSRVRLRYKRNGEYRDAQVLLAQVRGEALEQLQVTEPFGVFVSAMPGCKKHQAYRLRAFDAAGSALGKGRLRHLGFSCPHQGIGVGVFGREEGRPRWTRAY
jgi:hypothetical protein